MKTELLPQAARDVIADLHEQDNRATEEAHQRAAETQRRSEEERHAKQQVAHLREAAALGTLIKEDRSDGVIAKSRDDERLHQAEAEYEDIRRRNQKWATSSHTPVERMTAKRATLELERFAGRNLMLVDRPHIVQGKGEHLTETLQRYRDDSLALIDEKRAVEKAPKTEAEVLQASNRDIDKLADSGMPGTLAMFHGAGISWPEKTVAGRQTMDGAPLVAFLLRDQLKAEVAKLIRFNAGAFADGVSAEDKAERLAELDAEIDAAERLEAAAVQAVIASGDVAYHRPNCSVLAVLSLRVE